MSKFYLKCQSCLSLWQIIGHYDAKLKGRLLINPYTSLCYLCEKEWNLPARLNNLWFWNETQKQWEKWEVKND